MRQAFCLVGAQRWKTGESRKILNARRLFFAPAFAASLSPRAAGAEPPPALFGTVTRLEASALVEDPCRLVEKLLAYVLL